MSLQFLYIDDDVKRDFLCAPDDEVTDPMFPIPFGIEPFETRLRYRDRLRAAGGVQLFATKKTAAVPRYVFELATRGSLAINKKNGWSQQDPVIGVRFCEQRQKGDSDIYDRTISAATLDIHQFQNGYEAHPGHFRGKRMYSQPAFFGIKTFREWTPEQLKPFMTDQQREIYGL